MKVSDAVASRFSCRAFTDQPVSEAAVRRLLDRARRAPSGGNVQPWRVYVLAGDALAALLADVEEARKTLPMGRPPEYPIYPAKLKSPWRDYRFKCGEDMYGAIGVPREDKAERLRHFARNYRLFGAPVGLFLYLDRQMGPPQWSDAGMFLQTLMLLAREEGLHSCAQEAWAVWAEEVTRHTGAPDNEMLFCGLALGHADMSHPINGFRTDRAEVEEFAVLKGFPAG